MTKKHQKHAKITKPTLGQFGRNEFAILGTPCGEIKKLTSSISQILSNKHKIAYIDADHKSADDLSNLEGSSLEAGNTLEYVDKIDFHRFDTKTTLNSFQYKSFFNEQDLVLVNGNHFEAKSQIVVIDSRKSLEKKLHKLTNVVLFLFADEKVIPTYLASHLSEHSNIPTLAISEITKVCDFIDQELIQNTPKLNGLVLAGGKSTRMKRDKSQIKYFDKPQKEHMFGLLDPLTDQSFYAVREDQESENANCIKDSFTGLGPYGAILSAFRENPNAAWLVAACDQPFLTKEVLELLITNRNTSKVATAFYNPETDFPEPLITIWEPRAYPILLNYLSQGYSCPRKVLINSEIELIKLDDPSVLDNANTPEEYEAAVTRLGD